MQAKVKHRGFAGFFADLVDFLLGLAHDFFDARGMDSTVGDQRTDRQARDFAAYRVEARDGDGFGGVIDDDVDAGGGFERADVATFATDEAALQVVGRQLHHGHGALVDELTGVALNRRGDDGLGAAGGFFLGVFFDALDVESHRGQG